MRCQTHCGRKATPKETLLSLMPRAAGGGFMDGYLTVYTRGPKGVDFAEKRLWSLFVMIKMSAHQFVTITTMLTRIEGICKRGNAEKLTDSVASSFINQLEKIIEECNAISGLEVSIICAEEMHRWLNANRETKEFGRQVAGLRDTIRRELETKFVFTLTAAQADHYINFRKDWELIYERFPEALIDIEEARKCFALGRYAAAVFHTLQIIEHGLLELGQLIGVSDPKSGWTAVSKELTKIVEKKRDLRSDFEKENFSLIEQLQATVEALKNAWRNKISHAQGRLTPVNSEFTPDIAEEIIFATRAFMRRLVELLPSKPLE